MSQAFAEIRHFRKCLGNSGNAWTSLNCLGISRNAQAVAEIGNQLYLIYNIQNLGKGTPQNLILKLNQANLTLPNLNATCNWGQLFTCPNRGFHPQAPILVPNEAMSFFHNCLGISGNAWDLNTIYFTPFHFWEMAKHSKQTYRSTFYYSNFLKFVFN